MGEEKQGSGIPPMASILKLRPGDIEKNLQKQADENREYNERLRKREKTTAELTLPVEFRVLDVQGYISGTSISPVSEWRAGARSPSYPGGDSSRLEIYVLNPSIPIKKLEIIGLPPIFKHDVIRAYIMKGKYEQFRRLSGGMGGIDMGGESSASQVLVEREWQESESPVKIDKLGDRDLILATYHFR